MELQIFKYENARQIRTVTINGEVWFVAKDVCEILDISNPRDAVSRLDDDEKGVGNTDTLGGKQKTNIVNESGLYSLVFSSIKPEAKTFRKWITSEVLPQIRKTGSYGKPKSRLPAFATRANANYDRIEKGYFSVINEMVIRLYGKLEMAGYLIPDVGTNGQEIRPDISVGKLFPKWLQRKSPRKAKLFKMYSHRLPNDMEVQARQYKLSVLPTFIDFVDNVWMQDNSYEYFCKRDTKALAYIQ